MDDGSDPDGAKLPATGLLCTAQADVKLDIDAQDSLTRLETKTALPMTQHPSQSFHQFTKPCMHSLPLCPSQGALRLLLRTIQAFELCVDKRLIRSCKRVDHRVEVLRR
jgi:hypothetical protein